MIKWMTQRKQEPAQNNVQSTSKENDLKSTLLSYKKEHRGLYVYFSESEKLIRSLRTFLTSGQLATEGAFWKTNALVEIYTKIPDQPSRTIVIDFLVDANVPEFLTEIVRNLHYNHRDVFRPEKQGSNADQDEIKTLKTKASTKTENEKPAEACHVDKDVKYSIKDSLMFELLGVLHNLAKRINNKKYFESGSNAVETLLSFFRTQFSVFRMTALLCLAYLVDEKNNHLIMASEEPIKDILKLLEKASNSADRRSLGFSAAEIAFGISHVATNDGNKKMIGQLGGIPLLVSLLKGPEGHMEEKLAAVRALYMLSFDETNKAMIKADNDTMELLKRLQNSDNKEIQQAASGVIWEIEGKKEHAHSSDSEEHVMISYQWDTQETMLRVKAELEAIGFIVWMDVEQMEGSILETMARAVEKSYLLLLAVSRKYQNSPNCRSEAEYAYQRRKRIVPLMMESSYSPDGWLGIILGSKLWMDFRHGPDVGIQQLLKELSRVKAVTAKTQSVLSSPPSKALTNEKVLQWQREDVAKWLHDIGFEVSDNDARGKLDGPLLHMLNDLRKESPEFFYNSIKTDLGLPTVVEVLQFTKELKDLFS